MPDQIRTALSFIMVGLGAFGLGLVADRLVPGSKPADWLSLAGTMLGTLVAVGSSLAAVAVARTDKQRRVRRFVTDILEDLAGALATIELFASGGIPKNKGLEVMIAADRVVRGAERIRQAEKVAEIDNISLMRAFEAVDIFKDDARLTELHESAFNAVTDQSDALLHPPLRLMANQLTWQIARARTLLEGGEPDLPRRSVSSPR